MRKVACDWLKKFIFDQSTVHLRTQKVSKLKLNKKNQGLFNKGRGRVDR